MAQIDFDAIKRRTLEEADWAGLAAKASDMAKRDLTVLRASNMTVTDIQQTSQAYGFDVVFIDYVQLITPEVDRRAPPQGADGGRPILGVLMQIGDIRRETPSFWTAFGYSKGELRKCRMVYLHPQRRFYTVKFAFPLTEERFRKNYYFEDRRGDTGQSGERGAGLARQPDAAVHGIGPDPPAPPGFTSWTCGPSRFWPALSGRWSPGTCCR